MKRIALVFSLLATPAFADEPTSQEASKALDNWVADMQSQADTAPILGHMVMAIQQHYNVIIGIHAGEYLTIGNDNLLLGSCTSTPTPETSHFVNIANKLCFWRNTGEKAECPKPFPGCEGLE